MTPEGREKVAYDTFRNGFGGAANTPPRWEALPAWIRDVAKIAYLQGILDGKPKRHTISGSDAAEDDDMPDEVAADLTDKLGSLIHGKP